MLPITLRPIYSNNTNGYMKTQSLFIQANSSGSHLSLPLPSSSLSPPLNWRPIANIITDFNCFAQTRDKEGAV